MTSGSEATLKAHWHYNFIVMTGKRERLSAPTKGFEMILLGQNAPTV
jgi:hypothetical protein